MKKIHPMRVVSDSDVLIHLLKLEKLSLLQSLYREVAIPEYVKLELLIKENPEKIKAKNFRIHPDILQKAINTVEEI